MRLFCVFLSIVKRCASAMSAWTAMNILFCFSCYNFTCYTKIYVCDRLIAFHINGIDRCVNKIIFIGFFFFFRRYSENYIRDLKASSCVQFFFFFIFIYAKSTFRLDKWLNTNITINDDNIVCIIRDDFLSAATRFSTQRTLCASVWILS